MKEERREHGAQQHTNLGQSSEPGPHPGVGHLAYKVFKKTHKITNARSDSSSISR